MFTKYEYKKKLKIAIYESINFRWKLLKQNPNANVPDCQLCQLKNEINNFKSISCEICPGLCSDKDCCNGYYAWFNNPIPENAQIIIDYLNSIDIESWTNHLFGIIK